MSVDRLSHTRAQIASHGRAGFTALELLVTITIIIILVGILTIGLRSVTATSKNNACKVTLGNLQGMIAEMEALTGLNRQPPLMYLPDGNTHETTDTPPMNFWRDADPSETTDPEPDPAPPIANGASPAIVTTENPAYRYDSIGVLNTQIAIRTLLAVPANKTAFGKFTTQQLMELVPAGTTSRLLPVAPAGAPRPEPSIPLDPWGNPILFVPSGGLAGVVLEAHPDDEHTITSRGPLEDATVGAGVSYTEVPSGLRPFWASAGPDGNFTTGDDNVYSFEN